MVVLYYIISFFLLPFVVFLIVKGIFKFIKNDRGWRRMEEVLRTRGCCSMAIWKRNWRRNGRGLKIEY